MLLFLLVKPRNEWLNYIEGMFNFLKTIKLVSKVVVPFYIPINSAWEFHFLHTFTKISVYSFSSSSMSALAFTYISLTTNDFENFSCTYLPFVNLLNEVSVQMFLFIFVGCFLIIDFWKFSILPGCNLSNTWFAHIFYWVYKLVFHSPRMSLAEQKWLLLIKFKWSTFC